MIEISNSIEIKRQVNEVFAFVVDLRNNPRWQPVLTVEKTSEGPIGVGTTFKQRFQLMGAAYDMDCVITAFEPSQKISFKYASPVFMWEGDYVFQEIPSSTRVTARGSVTLLGALKYAETMFAPKIRKLINDTAPRLKQAMEG